MQSLSDTTIAASPQECAVLLLDALPPIMRVVRKHMRCHRDKTLSMPQFRTLALLHSAPSVNLSAVADFLGASLPTASRIVSGLVTRGYIFRKESPTDRRQIQLLLTPRGSQAMMRAREETQNFLGGQMEALSISEREQVASAMQALYKLFTPALNED